MDPSSYYTSSVDDTDPTSYMSRVVSSSPLTTTSSPQISNYYSLKPEQCSTTVPLQSTPHYLSASSNPYLHQTQIPYPSEYRNISTKSPALSTTSYGPPGNVKSLTSYSHYQGNVGSNISNQDSTMIAASSSHQLVASHNDRTQTGGYSASSFLSKLAKRYGESSDNDPKRKRHETIQTKNHSSSRSQPIEVLGRQKDEFDAYGEFIASKFRHMDPTMRGFIRKIVDRLILEAESGRHSMSDVDDDSDAKITDFLRKCFSFSK